MKRILSIDRGSSSIKFAVYEVEAAHEQRLLYGEVEPMLARSMGLEK